MSVRAHFRGLYSSLSVLSKCNKLKNSSTSTFLQLQLVRSYAKERPQIKLTGKMRQTPREKPAVRKRGTGAGLPLLIIPVTCVGLGLWQVQRKQWKQGVIKDLEDKMNRPPIPLPANLDTLSDPEMEYVRVFVKGKFDHSRELFVGPRTNHNAEHKEMGVHVVTPLKLSGRSETILVNRGHVSWRMQPHQLRQEGQIEEEVEFIGVVRCTEKKALGVGLLEEKHCYPNRDVEQLSLMAGTSCAFVDADINSTVPGGPVGGQTRLQIRDEHLQYIFTWFSLAAITYYIWWRSYKNPRPHKSVIEFLKKEHKRL